VPLCLRAGLTSWLITSRPTYEVGKAKLRRQNPRAQNPEIMKKTEDSRLRQLWQLSNALFKVRKSALTQKDVKNEDRSSEFIENKGAKRAVLGVY
jgi:hypothetical protein